MNNAIFAFSKPTTSGTVASARLANFVSEQLQLPVYWDEKIAKGWDILYVVAGAYAFCNALEHIAVAIEKSKRVIWIQNDYTIVPPKAESQAESPFRKAFRIRREKGLPDIDYWTTIGPLSFKTPNSRYINWNMLAWEPLTDAEYKAVEHHKERAVLYYGAFRQNRLKTFDKFFGMKDIPWAISNNTDRFEQRYPHLQGRVVKSIPRDCFREYLAQHTLGLYIEDDKSHKEFHSPANRFYEMLGARLPMVFQKEAVGMLSEAGLDVRPWVADTEKGLLYMLNRAKEFGDAQRNLFYDDYMKQLVRAVQHARKAAEK